MDILLKKKHILGKTSSDFLKSLLPIALELHKKFIKNMANNPIAGKPLFSEEMVLKMISGIYLEKIKYFFTKDFPLVSIGFMFFLNKYGNMKNIAEKKYYQVLYMIK